MWEIGIGYGESVFVGCWLLVVRDVLVWNLV